MTSTREQILAAAARLFGEKGYHNVSMRTISTELGISVGNLTYHFPRKADLADALLEQEMKEIAVPLQPGLEVLDEYLRRMLRSLLEHARLFSDPLMFSSVPELAEEHRARIRRLRSNLLELLRVQAQAGLLRPELDGETLEELADLLMYSHLGWQQQLMLFPMPVEDALRRALHLQWTAIRPYLTPEGQRQLEVLCRDGQRT